MNNLKNANFLFAQGKYEEAYFAYKNLTRSHSFFGDILKANIKLCELRLGVLSNGENFKLIGTDRYKRAAVFAGFSSNNKIEDYVVFYLKHLRELFGIIVYVCDNSLPIKEKQKLAGIVDHVIAKRHDEYDFGSYKIGFNYLKNNGFLIDADFLLLCNDSCYGPLDSFNGIFQKMESRSLDFWGLTKNTAFSEHLQSYFVSFSRKVFNSDVFINFINSVEVKKNVGEVVLSYEVPMTQILSEHGFSWGSFIDNSDPEVSNFLLHNTNLTFFPKLLLCHGGQLLKVKSITKPSTNLDGVDQTLNFIKCGNVELYNAIKSHESFAKDSVVRDVGFSVILPVKDGEKTIKKAIDSVFIQNYDDVELIVVDDGSSDGTERVIRDHFGNYLDSGVIKYVKLSKNLGVANARNVGLVISKKEWISYLDADNVMAPHYFSAYKSAITENKDLNCFYSKFKCFPSGRIGGRDFDYKALLNGNYIDNGVFVHRNIKSNNNFYFHDVNLKRLVDWDFILSFCKYNKPFFIDSVTLLYSDDESSDRITKAESHDDAYYYIREKHSLPERVTTIVFAYNHADYIEEALRSAALQELDLEHEVLFLDDASTDETWNKFLKVSKEYPGVIKGIKHKKNLGQARNFEFGIKAARGDYIAVLEGDDYWHDNRKLEKQINFLRKNTDCSMVFSKLRLLNQETKNVSFLKRQNEINKSKLTAEDFLLEPSMNLIGNFSSCLYRAIPIKKLPAYIYDQRVTEIGVAFHCDKFGCLGFIDEALSTYRQHSAGLWTGATKEKQKIMAIETREMVKRVANPRWHKDIQLAIDKIQGS